MQLLLRAATKIGDYREFVDLPIKDGRDIVFELYAMASAVDLIPKETVASMILEAAEVMKACKQLLETQHNT